MSAQQGTSEEFRLKLVSVQHSVLPAALFRGKEIDRVVQITTKRAQRSTVTENGVPSPPSVFPFTIAMPNPCSRFEQ